MDLHRPESREIIRRQMCMAAPFEVTLRGADERLLVEAARDVFFQARKVEELLSRFLPDTEICILNHMAAREPVRVEPTTFALLARCCDYWRWSGGALDVTVAPLLALWDTGGRGRRPSPDQIARTLAHVGMDKVLFEEPTLFMAFAREGVMLDLGAVGKGTALDVCLAVLRASWRIDAALLSFGRSTIGAIGGPWDIPVASPRDETATAFTAALADEALSVSSVGPRRYVHRAYDGDEVDHIIDPRTGAARAEILAVSAIARSAEAADALTTALVVLGEEDAAAVAARFGARTVVFTRPDGARLRNHTLDVASGRWSESVIDD